MLDRGRPVDARDDDVGLVESPVDVALPDLPDVHLALEVRIPVTPVVDDGRLGIGAHADVEQRRLLGEVDLDGVDRGHRRLLVGCGDERDRLALVAHVLLRQERLVLGDAEGREVPVREERHVLPRDDRVDARQRLGLRRVEPCDVGVVDRRAQRLRPERPRDAHVVDERRPTGDVRDTVVAWKACADRLHSDPSVTSVVVGVPVVIVRSKLSPRTAAPTAFTIFT